MYFLAISHKTVDQSCLEGDIQFERKKTEHSPQKDGLEVEELKK